MNSQSQPSQASVRPGVREAFGILREQREPQLQMAELVDSCINNNQNAIIEAGTGTGKSFGYLIPVVSQGKKAVVATFTIALQEQLMRFDIPFLQQALREKFGIRFTAAMLKGASNYLCQRRAMETNVELPSAIATWVDETETGDLNDAPPMDAPVKEALRIDLDDCGRQKCPFYATCHYQRAKAAAKNAHVLIVNQKLFSMGLENEFLLDLSGYHVAIIDEAHQFEDVARDSFGSRLSPRQLAAFFKKVEQHLVELEEGDDGKPKLEAAWVDLRDAFRAAWAQVIAPWTPLVHADGSPFTDEKLLIAVEHVRAKSEPAVVALDALASWVRARLKDETEHNKIDRQLTSIRDFFVALSTGDAIAVAERKIRDGARFAEVTLEAYPLELGPRLQQSLYGTLPVIYTSATISAGGDFSLAKQTLGLADSAPQVEIGSPFDYPDQALLYVPNDARFDGRNDNRETHMAAFQAETHKLLNLSQGRAFVLFTSNRSMKDAFFSRKHSFPARWQEPNSNKNELIQWFKETPNAVLYATASFWEGVSIEGDQLSLVVIDRIPFPPPTDPIYRAKGARLGAKKEFFALSVPSAIIKLKQGFGRLIRTQSDRGLVAILDSRIHGKGYGKQILRSLPDARLITDLADQELIARYMASAEKPELVDQVVEVAAAEKLSLETLVNQSFGPDHLAAATVKTVPLVTIESAEHLEQVLDAAAEGPAALANLGITFSPDFEAVYAAWEATF